MEGHIESVQSPLAQHPLVDPVHVPGFSNTLYVPTSNFEGVSLGFAKLSPSIIAFIKSASAFFLWHFMQVPIMPPVFPASPWVPPVEQSGVASFLLTPVKQVSIVLPAFIHYKNKSLNVTY